MNVSIATAKAGSHPTRLKILEVMAATEPISPNRLANEMDEPLGNVSYHVKTLEEYGQVELDHTEPRRGAVEHFYRRSPAAMVGEINVVALDEIAAILRTGDVIPTEVTVRLWAVLAMTGRRA